MPASDGTEHHTSWLGGASARSAAEQQRAAPTGSATDGATTKRAHAPACSPPVSAARTPRPGAARPRADGARGAVQYGLSVLEGLKVLTGADGVVRLFRVDAHARRFAKSAEAVCMPQVPPETFIAAVRALTREDAAWHPGDPG